MNFNEHIEAFLAAAAVVRGRGREAWLPPAVAQTAAGA